MWHCAPHDRQRARKTVAASSGQYRRRRRVHRGPAVGQPMSAATRNPMLPVDESGVLLLRAPTR